MKVSFEEKLIELRKSRIDRPKTQTELGVYIGLGLRQYQRYEDGEAIPEIKNLIKLSELFKYDLVSHITDGDCVIISLLKENTRQEPGIKELVEAIEKQNQILKAGFNLNADLKKPVSDSPKSGSPSKSTDETHGKRKVDYNEVNLNRKRGKKDD